MWEINNNADDILLDRRSRYNSDNTKQLPVIKVCKFTNTFTFCASIFCSLFKQIYNRKLVKEYYVKYTTTGVQVYSEWVSEWVNESVSESASEEFNDTVTVKCPILKYPHSRDDDWNVE